MDGDPGKKGDSPVIKIRLCTYYYTWNRLGAGEVDNLVVDNLHHIEGGARGDRIDKNEAMDTDGVVRIEDGKFILVKERGLAGRSREEGIVALPDQQCR